MCTQLEIEQIGRLLDGDDGFPLLHVTWIVGARRGRRGSALGVVTLLYI